MNDILKVGVYRGRKPQKVPPYRIKLTCGCTVLSRVPPRTRLMRMICTSGLAHGYSLAWTSYSSQELGREATHTINPERTS